ncbi:MAG: tetratricopeptide repeat protein [Candidatus Eisenbacteria bacterium]|uniref:Tetratricopeptide repeat protein n=1 Tax=Eiseniibacteriota bacterium TaxID=2212470 RepID=A0A538S910_UNCEI|nr:MAG: tetratricopeptide repeat protein [Candidatus Eisenbacteria bacterium]
MIGTTLSHYRILEPLGQGGMGEVYRAHDLHLDRDVAIKVLLSGALADPTARDRFRREAHVLSRLSHPGVATIFDFDTQDRLDFLVMEYVPGGTLQSRLGEGAMGLDELMRLGAEIGDALEAAHRLGFLHRDLKPGNVVLTATGMPKILDFGLAGLLHTSHTATDLTRAGAVFGSLPYMAPEQVRGEEGDSRTDVYAFGVILYEMATGRRPFQKDRPEALMFEVLHEATRPARSLRPEIPPELDRLIESCLSKDPAHRPSSAGAVSLTLRRIREPARRDSEPAPDVIRSLAVLPLQNVSRDPAQEYFADGMTEALITELARVKALRVISRTSAMKYKGVQRALPEIARELNVDAILEGSALLVGKRVRVTVQLVSAKVEEMLWGDRYDGEIEDVLDMQSRVAETVAKEIAVKVTPREAKEWAGIAHCHNVRAGRGMAPPAEANAQAREAAMKALELDDSLAQAHSALGIIAVDEGDFPSAIRSLQRAVELNPGLTSAYTGLGSLYYCSERHREAQEMMLKALSLDPLSMMIHTCVGDAYYYAREYERSLVYYRKAVELDPRFDGAHTDLARSLEALGRFDEARGQYEEGRRMSGGVAGPSFGLGHLEASSGNEAGARKILQDLTEARSRRVVSAWGIAALHASLGDVDEAFRWLDFAVDEHATGLMFLRVHPRLDRIRQDPRYRALVRKVGLDAV